MKNETLFKLDLPREKSSIIKVIGVGGGGSNAVNHMYRQGIAGVDFFVCNTDSQALELSPVTNKIPIGDTLTEGLGAGSEPKIGREAAEESLEDIIERLGLNTKMLFVTAGLGGGTGTGAAPVIAKTAKTLGILTVAIVTTPFSFEGKKRIEQAQQGLEEIKKCVDALLVISNDRLQDMYSNLTISNAFSIADNVLTIAAKGIAEIITLKGIMNVDFADVKTAMTNSGVAIMGNGIAEGEGRALKAAKAALESPLLDENQIIGAKNILLNISYGTEDILMEEAAAINEFFQEQAGMRANLKWGYCKDEVLGKKISVTIIATGFEKENKFRVQDADTEKKANLGQQIDEQINPSKRATQVSMFDAIESDTKTELEKNTIKQDLNEADAERTERQKKRMEEMRNLKSIQHLAENPDEMEKEPAYIRKRVQFDETPHSDAPILSRYSLSEDEESKKVEIKKNNSFLHDNVD
jgi:cell division protein FtsZ